jgi:phosphate transport system permease protein
MRAGKRLDPGLPGIWSTALTTALVLGMLLVLLWIVAVNAFGWFWPAPIRRVTLDDGSVLNGLLVGREAIKTEGAEAYRIQMKTGNRELTGRDFVWVDESSIVSTDEPPDLVRLIRTEYGDAFGRIIEAHGADGTPIDIESREALESFLGIGESWRQERRSLEQEMERVRRPLTRLEEQLDLLERSARADTDEGRREIAELTEETERTATDLAPQLSSIDQSLVTVAERLSSAGMTIAAGDQQLQIPLGNVLDLVWANRMGFLSRCWWATREGVRFLFPDPREANTEGGIFPALFGTVLLVLLMSLAVMPLGVITAVYMTEYATEGIILRLANQAVNNLAGVPSIVFGMFGLAFFIYGVGGFMDRALFAEQLPTPTFGTGGVLWASLTLALLTVPVVVVATREGLLAVPRSWREGSLALGATRWQTLRQIILPSAMPGILTGLILAVSRAAGEVAPLMLTGAVKLAPSLPVDGLPPFLHLQRKFMHLGFHIYDVSMQSPNVEAAKPMAFATTLVLLLLVALINLAAIIIRRRLRRAYSGQAV